MLKHHLLIAIRGMKKFRSSFYINLIGLSTGLACAFLIYLWVNDEWKFDKFHSNDKQLFQVMELDKQQDKLFVREATQGPLAAALKKDLPEVENSVLFFNLAKEGLLFNLRTNDKSIRAAGAFAGKDMFKIFSFPVKQGSANTVLSEKNSIVLSEKTAKNLFGTAENAVGKSVEFEITGMKKNVQVSGVFEDIPANSSLQFDFALTEELLIQDLWTNGQVWSNEGPATYIVLKKGTDLAKFNNKIKDFIQKYHRSQFSLFVRPFSDAYLYGNYENGVQAGGRIAYVRLFSFVAILILIIACINFMNLSTARASRRLKEVGVKKTMGIGRRQLIFQFLTEAVFISFFSLLIAVLLVVIFLPGFNEVTGKQITLHFSPQLLTMALLVTLATGLLSGSYPAFYLSGFNPVTILKGKIKNSVGELLARKGLVVFQFVVSLVLIVAMLVIYRQVEFIQNRNLGYNKENVIYFDKTGKTLENTESFLAELKKVPGVVNASAIQQNVIQGSVGNASTYGIEWPGKEPEQSVNFTVRSVDYDLLETLGIQLKEGRAFSRTFGTDNKGLIFNETAIQIMGLKNPLGTKVRMWDQEMEIIGVVRDFHISSLHESIAPMVFRLDPSRTAMIMAKLQAGKERESMAAIESFYKRFNPGYPFDYKFLDASFQAQYVAEKRISALSTWFASLAILISCLGLFGLASFNAEVRTKEIGIRKVLGASERSIVFLLSADFFKLLLAAIAVAFPIAWWAMNKWLGAYAYKTTIGIDVFLLAFFASAVFTLITIGFQSVKAAITNPVKNLRTE